MNHCKLVLPSAALALLLAPAFRLNAKPEYTKLEKTQCKTCHINNKSKELNEIGKQYKETKKLPPEAKK